MDSRSHTPVTAALRLCLHALLTGLLALVGVRAVGGAAPHAGAVVALVVVMAAVYAAGAVAGTRGGAPAGSETRDAAVRPEGGAGAQARPETGAGAQARPATGAGAQARPETETETEAEAEAGAEAEPVRSRVRAGSPSLRPGTRAAAVWLGGLCALWIVLLVLSPDALWVAFPLYFLQLHLLPTRSGVAAVLVTAAAAITSFVAHRQEIAPGAFIGPLLGAAVAIATVLGYDALFRESERRRELIVELVATRAELAEAERTAGTLAERERLAREIHDTLAQGLSSIQLLLRAAERTLPGNAPATAHVRAAREAAQANLAEARSFV
ncbi:two-component sensor histidine kinase, partial [Streptomyces sp. ZEA17I]|uniref:histidine kinase n=1 Tax=Streptomyces sp. ZEA17I TaxID=2202516 RepID=UPI000D6EE4F5